MNKTTEIDQVLDILRRKQACGGMSYPKAVHTETLITAFESMRVAVIAADVAATVSVAPKLSETTFDAFLKSVSEMTRWMVLAEMRATTSKR